ncbi:hypothetical protein PsAD46_03752 [Pseudovibrio sp. Ad46]|uniref:hypothetical protein n=1 Tax=Pseudovibrio sp. Ad46 TaxID=989432 RepID=UPI0007AE8B97|nr:hypothetical protein [Pseudovibrio sp. Ad46]KZK81619.1 hypothetical protein PsAD46_03752 [Pseudovibrio sp. Ad46]
MSSSTLSNSRLVQISEIAGIGEARSQAKIVTGKLADSFADDQKIQKKTLRFALRFMKVFAPYQIGVS